MTTRRRFIQIGSVAGAGLFLYYGIVAIVDWATQEKEICTQPTIN